MACSPTDDLTRHFQTYLTRLAHVLDEPAPELIPPTLSFTLPSQRELTLAPPRIRSGLLDSLKLSECDLLGLVAEHNAPAGKSQTAAGQFAYHLQFQQGLQACLKRTSDTELHAWLQDIADRKAPLLDDYFWNMMVAEPNIRAALTPTLPSLKFSAIGGYQATLSAFQLFAALQPPLKSSQVNSQHLNISSDINQALSALYQNRYLSQLLYSLHATSDYLEQTNQFLQQLKYLDCEGGHAIKAQRLRNAMQHYYIKDIQAYLVRLDRQFVSLAPLLEQTLLPPVNKSDIMQPYRQHIASNLNSRVYTRYRELTLDHAHIWQQFLQRCNISPN